MKKILFVILLLAAFAIHVSAQQGGAAFMTTTGETLTTTEMRGKVVVMVFSAVNDPQCRDEFKMLQSLAERYSRSNKVELFWVSTDAVDGQWKTPCGSTGGIKVVRDPNRAAFRQFGARQLPTIVILSPQGQVVGGARGGFSPNTNFTADLASVIDSLL
jgi:peroxiredoxin